MANTQAPIAEETDSHDTHAEGLTVESHAVDTHEEELSTAHEPTIFAEPVMHFGGFTVTNALLNTWIVVGVIILASAILRSKLKEVPRGFQNFIEIVVEGALNLANSVTGDRDKSIKFFPVAFSLFLFILLNNWLGFFPGVGSIGFFEVHDGHNTFIPLFRGGTADLNTTLALALVSVIGAHITGILLIGIWSHVNKFINLNALIEIPKKILKDPTIVLVNPIKAFVGLIEVVGEVAKVASLSFRLFGNIFAGEVLLASMAALFAYFVPIPFLFLEIIVGVIQALIFAILTLVYMTIASEAEEH